MTQINRILKLLQRRRGATAFELAIEGRTVSPHKRMSELAARGYTITRKPVRGEVYGRYFVLPLSKE